LAPYPRLIGAKHTSQSQSTSYPIDLFIETLAKSVYYFWQLRKVTVIPLTQNHHQVQQFTPSSLINSSRKNPLAKVNFVECKQMYNKISFFENKLTMTIFRQVVML
jgi:hypothetical protein